MPGGAFHAPASAILSVAVMDILSDGEHPYNDKGQCLYPPPGENPPTRTQGRKLSKRALLLTAPADST